jgi:hypothetical protein
MNRKPNISIAQYMGRRRAQVLVSIDTGIFDPGDSVVVMLSAFSSKTMTVHKDARRLWRAPLRTKHKRVITLGPKFFRDRRIELPRKAIQYCECQVLAKSDHHVEFFITDFLRDASDLDSPLFKLSDEEQLSDKRSAYGRWYDDVVSAPKRRRRARRD